MILHKGHYFFYFQGTLAGAKCNKHTRASYSWLLLKKQIQFKMKEQQAAVVSSEHTRHLLFFLPLTFICGKKITAHLHNRAL